MFKRPLITALTATALMAGTAQAENVEIYLVDMLDNIQQGYCLDIAGGRGAQADPADGLQGHTCYSPGGSLGVDQTFDTARFEDGTIYMTEFDVCAEITSPDAGSQITLAACNGGDAQSFDFSGEGVIRPTTASDMCLTVGEETRFGRSKENQIKVLTLEPCDAANAAYQVWGVRSSVD